jgi:phycocyanobilin lyase subunit beta
VISIIHPEWRSQIDFQFAQMFSNDQNPTVRARIQMAQQQLQAQMLIPEPEVMRSPLSETDWRIILDNLYARKNHERFDLTEGNPLRYRNLANAIAPKLE